VDIGIYTPPPKKKKSAQVNFLRGKNEVRTAIQQFYTPLPKKAFIPRKQISGYAPGESPFVVSCRARFQIPLERRKRACRRLVTGIVQTISICRDGLKPINISVIKFPVCRQLSRDKSPDFP